MDGLAVKKWRLIILALATAWIIGVTAYQFGTDDLRDGLITGLFFGKSWKLGLVLEQSSLGIIVGFLAYTWVARRAKSLREKGIRP